MIDTKEGNFASIKRKEKTKNVVEKRISKETQENSNVEELEDEELLITTEQTKSTTLIKV